MAFIARNITSSYFFDELDSDIDVTEYHYELKELSRECTDEILKYFGDDTYKTDSVYISTVGSSYYSKAHLINIDVKSDWCKSLQVIISDDVAFIPELSPMSKTFYILLDNKTYINTTKEHKEYDKVFRVTDCYGASIPKYIEYNDVIETVTLLLVTPRGSDFRFIFQTNIYS